MQSIFCRVGQARNQSIPMMNFFDPFSITLLLSGGIFVIAAEWTRRRPPKTINHLYGYRTKASMASQERWDFAQQASSVRSRFWGWVMITLGMFGLGLGGVPVIPGVLLSVGILITCCVLLLTGTEKDLKKHFGPLQRP